MLVCELYDFLWDVELREQPRKLPWVSSTVFLRRPQKVTSALSLRSLEEFWNLCLFSVVNHSVLCGVYNYRPKSNLIEWKRFFTVTGSGGRDCTLLWG